MRSLACASVKLLAPGNGGVSVALGIVVDAGGAVVLVCAAAMPRQAKLTAAVSATSVGDSFGHSFFGKLHNQLPLSEPVPDFQEIEIAYALGNLTYRQARRTMYGVQVPPPSARDRFQQSINDLAVIWTVLDYRAAA
jgi:hypothetical protein